jgi:hypothetical protein
MVVYLKMFCLKFEIKFFESLLFVFKIDDFLLTKRSLLLLIVCCTVYPEQSERALLYVRLFLSSHSAFTSAINFLSFVKPTPSRLQLKSYQLRPSGEGMVSQSNTHTFTTSRKENSSFSNAPTSPSTASLERVGARWLLNLKKSLNH